MRFVGTAPLSHRFGWWLVLIGVLAGCAAPPQRARAPTMPAAPVPSAAESEDEARGAAPGAAKVADAEPRIEAVQPGGANKPYQVLGREYVPSTRDVPFQQRGFASWYGGKFHGRRTASGEIYDMYAMTAAHPVLPIPSYARIRNPANGREVLVRINDRGPFHAGRIVDLSYAAAARLGVLRNVAPVEIDRITFDEIRAGTWRGKASRAAPAPPPETELVSEAALPAAAARHGDAALLLVATALPDTDSDSTPTPTVTVTATPTPTAPADAPASRALTAAARGFWVQLGAFRDRTGAEAFQRRVGVELEAVAPMFVTFAEVALFRVQAGPYPSRDQARAASHRMRESLGVVPTIVERK